MADDIISDVSTDEKLVDELKVEQHRGTVERSIEKNPLAQSQTGLSQPLLNMLTLGKTTAMFQGVEKCIRVVDKGSTSQRHCLSMIVSEANRGKVCTRCDVSRPQGFPEPKIINSSMIKLNDKELKECGLDSDPTYVAPAKRTQAVPAVEAPKPRVKRQYTRREPKVAAPNAVKIEISLKDLDTASDITRVLLTKALEAIYELPITKFSEAEAIRGTSERIKLILNQQEA
jgi:hypothetical protein